MPAFVPLFLVATDAKVTKLPSVARIEGLIADGLDTGAVFQSVSANSWHQSLTVAIQQAMAVEGLAFLLKQRALLPPQEVAAALSATRAIVSRLQHGQLPPIIASDDAAFLSEIDVPRELAAAEPTLDLEPEADIGPKAARGYCVYLKSLSSFLEHAQTKGRSVLHYAPPP